MVDHVARVLALVARQPPAPHAGTGTASWLQRVCAAASAGLAMSGAGLSVMAEDGVRGLSTASDLAAERLEELQFVLGEGPCIDAFAARRPVLVPDLDDGPAGRWPVYTPAAYEGGVRAIFAFPLRVGASRLGVLDLFRTEPGPLTAEQVALALVFADVAVGTLLDQQDLAAQGAAADGLFEAMDSRAELFQAQGMLTVQLGIPLAEAMARLRAYAYAQNRSLTAVAGNHRIVDVARAVLADPHRISEILKPASP